MLLVNSNCTYIYEICHWNVLGLVRKKNTFFPESDTYHLPPTLREFDGDLWVTFWELLAVTGSLLGVLEVVPGASRSGQNLSARPAIRPRRFFSGADFGATKWNCSRRNAKKDVQKSDIALVE